MLSRRIFWDIPGTLALVFFSILIIDKIISDGIKSSEYVLLEHRKQIGHVAEWLRRGLQILVSQFDSGRGLQKNELFCFFKKSMLRF